MMLWRPKLSQEHREALPHFLRLMAILVACGILLALA